MNDYPTRAKLIALCDAANVEVFHVDATNARHSRRTSGMTNRAGWYYWTCAPGCLPDSDAFGPFGSALAALRDAYDTFDLYESKVTP